MTSPLGKLAVLPLLAALALLGGCGKDAAPSAGAVDARRTIDAGWQQFGYGAYDAAADTFGRLARHAPEKSGEHLLALYGLATVWDLRRPGEDRELAARLYKQIASLQPQGDLAAWSRLALVRMQALTPVGTQPDMAAVRAGYHEVFEQYPHALAGQEAFILEQAALVQTFRAGDARTALASLEKFTREQGQSRYLAAAHALMADARHTLGEPDRRLAEEIRAFEIREDTEREQAQKHTSGGFHFDDAAASFKIAHIAEFEAGDFETARKFYRLFLQKAPFDKRVFYARQSLERMDRVEAGLRAEKPPLTPP